MARCDHCYGSEITSKIKHNLCPFVTRGRMAYCYGSSRIIFHNFLPFCGSRLMDGQFLSIIWFLHVKAAWRKIMREKNCLELVYKHQLTNSLQPRASLMIWMRNLPTQGVWIYLLIDYVSFENFYLNMYEMKLWFIVLEQLKMMNSPFTVVRLRNV